MQALRLDVWHQERPEIFVGRIELKLSELHNSREDRLVRDLQGGKGGRIVVEWERIAQAEINIIAFDLRFLGLQEKSFFCCTTGNLSPFIRISKRAGNSNRLVYESEMKEGRNPVFPSIRLTKHKLCSSDNSLALTCDILNYKDSGNHV